MSTLLQFFRQMLIIFAFVAYLIVLFQIVADLFRDREQSGALKAIWIIALIVFPLVTSVVYLIVRGKGMAERQVAQVKQAKADSDTYIREVAGRSPAQEIATPRRCWTPAPSPTPSTPPSRPRRSPDRSCLTRSL